MKRALWIACLCAVVAAPVAAHALSGSVSASIGEGVTFVRGGSAVRSPVSLEVTPAFGVSLLKFDLGLYLTMEKPAQFYFRPGLRLMIPFVYLRAAIPLRVTQSFDWGVLLGAGSNVFTLGFLSIFVEVDTFLSKQGNWKDVVPLDFRAGVTFGF